MKVHNIEQGTQEWMEVRLGKLTASTAQAIATAGKGLETLCFEKVAERMTGKAKEQYTNADMERGNELEQLARSSYDLETGNIVKEVGFVEMNEVIGCSPDGFVDKDGLVEIKCPNDANFARYMFTGKIEPKYQWQMMMQMVVCERNWVDYVVFNENFAKPTIIKRFEFDLKMEDKILAGLSKGTKLMEEIWQKIN
jgi:putative phage-type endonuclease